jgi:hypothetical protein
MKSFNFEWRRKCGKLRQLDQWLHSQVCIRVLCKEWE